MTLLFDALRLRPDALRVVINEFVDSCSAPVPSTIALKRYGYMPATGRLLSQG